jgi:hypothetical protein
MRYYFHFRSSSRYYADSEGDELADLPAAREEGRLSARELMGLDHGEPDLDYHGAVFEVATADGMIVALIQFDELLLGDTANI